jgi:hypothetical protein
VENITSANTLSDGAKHPSVNASKIHPLDTLTSEGLPMHCFTIWQTISFLASRRKKQEKRK